jgi:tetratricopeptide (TPR) repeat protein
MSEAELHLAIAAHRAGQLSVAERHYRTFLQAQPDHGGAHHNLGLLIMQRGAPAEALAHLASACQFQPERGQNWFSYARAMLALGRDAEALPLLEQAQLRGISGPAFEAALQQAQSVHSKEGPAAAVARCEIALSDEPGNPERHFQLANALAALGQIEQTIASYQRAVELDPCFAEAHFRLGSLLSENGRIAQGFRHYLRRAELLHGRGSALTAGAPEPAHKIKHDREQSEYLALAGSVPRRRGSEAVFILEEGGRVAGPAVNPRNADDELLKRWHESKPRLVVIDDFLTPAALEKLRRYSLGSTIWRRVYDAGYIGATPEDGLACPLMAQITEEIRDTFRQIIGSHTFRYLGAFKYDSELCAGTNIHADNAAVNVNFYIAPDEANLDPQSGGLDVWDVAVTSEAQMRQLNADKAAARAFLENSKVKMTRIAHRANRAIVFRSDLIHRTSEFHFANGYRNRRINVSLMFGEGATAA